MTTIAAFDFDGTLCKGDAVVPFLAKLRGAPATITALLSIAPLLRTKNRDVMKRALAKKLLTGISAEEIDQVGKDFAHKVTSTKVFPQLQARLAWHQDHGHTTMLVSASFDAYLNHVAEQLNLDSVLSTQIEFIDGVATGRLVNDTNVRSTTKADLLSKEIGGDKVELYAYGNSSGDIPMLRLATHPFMVDRRGNIRSWAG